MNPELDVGQVEGAFVMGLGFCLTEKIIYDPKTGQNLTNGTWVRESFFFFCLSPIFRFFSFQFSQSNKTIVTTRMQSKRFESINVV